MSRTNCKVKDPYFPYRAWLRPLAGRTKWCLPMFAKAFHSMLTNITLSRCFAQKSLLPSTIGEKRDCCKLAMRVRKRSFLQHRSVGRGIQPLSGVRVY